MVVTMGVIVITNDVALGEWWTRKPRRNVMLDLHDLTSAENNYWENRLNRLNADCGCAFGAAGLGIAAVLFPSASILGGYHRADRLALETGVFAMCMVVVAGLAKWTGVLRSRWLLRSSTLVLRNLIRERRGASG